MCIRLLQLGRSHACRYDYLGDMEHPSPIADVFAPEETIAPFHQFIMPNRCQSETPSGKTRIEGYLLLSKERLVLGSLLVNIGLGIVLLLIDLVARGVLGGSHAEKVIKLAGLCVYMAREMMRGSYRLVRLALLSLATSLLASLEVVEPACWTDSET